MERSTVDFIVPGEMELTSAVRSVSSSNKCNGIISAATKNTALNHHPPQSKSFFYSGEILTIELFVVPYSAFWSHFIVYIIDVRKGVLGGLTPPP